MQSFSLFISFFLSTFFVFFSLHFFSFFFLISFQIIFSGGHLIDMIQVVNRKYKGYCNAYRRAAGMVLAGIDTSPKGGQYQEPF